MISFNKQFIQGEVVNEPEVSNQGRTARGKVTVRTDRVVNKREGGQETYSDYHRVVAFGDRADTLGQVRQGDVVYVEGRSSTRKYQDKQNNNRYITELIAMEIQTQESRPQPQEVPSNAGGEDLEDDLPF